jgi:hypothetical protein
LANRGAFFSSLIIYPPHKEKKTQRKENTKKRKHKEKKTQRKEENANKMKKGSHTNPVPWHTEGIPFFCFLSFFRWDKKVVSQLPC